MKKKLYKNPNKYLISNEKFIRNFELMYKKISDPWNQKKQFFSGEQYLFLFSYINLMKNKFKKKKNVLDVGAGSGELKKMLNKNFRYHGIDIHKKKIKNVIYDDINCFNKSFSKKFDIIFCLKTIYYLGDNINKVLGHFQKYLKKGGILIISYNLKKDSFSNKYLTDLKLRKLLLKKFKEILTIEMNREKMIDNNTEKFSFFVFSKSK